MAPGFVIFETKQSERQHDVRRNPSQSGHHRGNGQRFIQSSKRAATGRSRDAGRPWERWAWARRPPERRQPVTKARRKSAVAAQPERRRKRGARPAAGVAAGCDGRAGSARRERWQFNRRRRSRLRRQIDSDGFFLGLNLGGFSRLWAAMRPRGSGVFSAINSCFCLQIKVAPFQCQTLLKKEMTNEKARMTNE